MPYPSISFLEQLEPAVGRALKKFGAMLTFFLSQEHKDDGTHGAITVDSVRELGRTAAQGYWTAVAFNAANFTASTGNWTLTSGDQMQYRYMLIGTTLFLKFRFDSTSVSAGTAQLRLTLPNSMKAAQDGFTGGLIYNDNGAGWNGDGHIYATAGLTYIEFHTATLANWAVAVDTTYVWGQAMVEIQ